MWSAFKSAVRNIFDSRKAPPPECIGRRALPQLESFVALVSCLYVSFGSHSSQSKEGEDPRLRYPRRVWVQMTGSPPWRRDRRVSNRATAEKGAAIMNQAKLLAIFPVMVTALAFLTSPAFGAFKSTLGESKGSDKSGALVIEGGGGTLECSSTEGEWTILSSEEKPATKGETLSATINKWNGCKAKSSEVKEATPVVSSCTFHLLAALGSSQATATVINDCRIQITILGLSCEINVTRTGNVGLQFTSLQNSGSSMFAGVAWVGVSLSAKGFCLGIKATVEGKARVSIFALGINWI